MSDGNGVSGNGHSQPEQGFIFVRPLSDREVIVFGDAADLDLLGDAVEEVKGPLLDAARHTVASISELQPAADELSGRVVRLTEESARLLRNHQPIVKDGAFLGVVRGSEGKFAGVLRFVNPGSNLATAAGMLPSISGAIAMQLQLAQIEQRLDEIKQDIAYLIESGHIEIEAGIETALIVLDDVFRSVQRRERVDDDQWDRIAAVELEIRALHAVTRKHLRALDAVLRDPDASLSRRVHALNTAMRDERTLFWLRAHVHSELALTRWDLLYLSRQAEREPASVEELVRTTERQIRERRNDLVELATRITSYLDRGDRVTTWLDRLRLVSRARMTNLLVELDDLMRIYKVDLMRTRAIEGSPESEPAADADDVDSRWVALVRSARAVPPAVRSGAERSLAKTSSGMARARDRLRRSES